MITETITKRARDMETDSTVSSLNVVCTEQNVSSDVSLSGLINPHFLGENRVEVVLFYIILELYFCFYPVYKGNNIKLLI